MRAFCFRRRVCFLHVVCLSSVCRASDLENEARYAQNFMFVGNRYRRARIWRQILHRKKVNSPKVAPNPEIVQNSLRAYCLALLSDAACLFGQTAWSGWPLKMCVFFNVFLSCCSRFVEKNANYRLLCGRTEQSVGCVCVFVDNLSPKWPLTQIFSMDVYTDAII